MDIPETRHSNAGKLGVAILANHIEHDLDVLTRRHSHAMLTLAGKPLIERNMELAADTGPDMAFVLAPEYDLDLAANIEDIDRWGISFNYSEYHKSFDHKNVYRHFCKHNFEKFVVIDADRVRNLHPESLKEILHSVGPGIHSLKIGNESTKISIFVAPDRPDGIDESPCAIETWENHDIDLLNHDIETTQYVIDTPQNYLEANLSIVSKKPKAVGFRGQERFIDVFCGTGTRIFPKSTLLAKAIIGRHCSIDKSVEFKGNVIIDDNVVIDRGTKVENSVILNNSYIGEHLQITRAIVAQNVMINVASGDILEIRDDFILADLTPDLYNTYLAQLAHQVAGIFLLLLSTPLWVLALVNALITSDKGIASRKIYQGNERQRGHTTRRLFYTWEFNCTCGILRKLPLLTAVALGHIRLVGASLYTPSEISRRPKNWKRICDDIPVGLLGPTQLTLGTKAPQEERLRSDAAYKSQRSYSHSWQILWKSALELRRIPGCGGSHLFNLSRHTPQDGLSTSK